MTITWLRRLLPPTAMGRLLFVNTAVASIGTGLYVSGAAIYYVRKLDLTPSQVGLAMTVGGLISLVTGVPLGRLCDRLGAREVVMAMQCLAGVLLVVAAFVTARPAVVTVIVALSVVEAGGAVCRSALVGAVMTRQERVSTSAYLRSMFNAGFTLGVLGAGVSLALDSRPAYQALFLVNAVAMLGTAALYLRVPHVARIRREHAPRGVVDLPYLAVAQASGLVRLGPVALSVGVPLWLVEHTSAPHPLAAWLTVVNTAIVIAFQVAASKGADTVPGAARMQTRALVVLAIGCGVAALSAGRSAWLAGGVLFVAVALFSFGEIWGESARWGFQYELAPETARGTYLGVFSTGDALAVAAGPVLVTTLPDSLGRLGWALLAALFAVGILLGRVAVAWAVRTRPTAEAAADETVEETAQPSRAA